MDIARILNELRSERDRLGHAIAALEALGAAGAAPRPAPVAAPRPAAPASRFAPRIKAQPGGPVHKISAQARRKMSEASKRMWAARKKKAGKFIMSPAARKRISEAKKKWWAARK